MDNEWQDPVQRFNLSEDEERMINDNPALVSLITKITQQIIREAAVGSPTKKRKVTEASDAGRFLTFIKSSMMVHLNPPTALRMRYWKLMNFEGMMPETQVRGWVNNARSDLKTNFVVSFPFLSFPYLSFSYDAI